MKKAKVEKKDEKPKNSYWEPGTDKDKKVLMEVQRFMWDNNSRHGINAHGTITNGIKHLKRVLAEQQAQASITKTAIAYLKKNGGTNGKTGQQRKNKK